MTGELSPASVYVSLLPVVEAYDSIGVTIVQGVLIFLFLQPSIWGSRRSTASRGRRRSGTRRRRPVRGRGRPLRSCGACRVATLYPTVTRVNRRAAGRRSPSAWRPTTTSGPIPRPARGRMRRRRGRSPGPTPRPSSGATSRSSLPSRRRRRRNNGGMCMYKCHYHYEYFTTPGGPLLADP